MRAGDQLGAPSKQRAAKPTRHNFPLVKLLTSTLAIGQSKYRANRRAMYLHDSGLFSGSEDT
jgi:hypothetical protein